MSDPSTEGTFIVLFFTRINNTIWLQASLSTLSVERERERDKIGYACLLVLDGVYIGLWDWSF